MNTLSPRNRLPKRFVLLGLFLAFAATSAIQAQDRVRTTASSGIFTLSPRQTVRLHILDSGSADARPKTARIELRTDRGVLLGFKTATLRPGAPIHLALRAANLLGSRPFLYVRAVAVIHSDIDDLASAPIFSFEVLPDAPGSLANPTGTQCPVRNMGDPPTPNKPVYSCGGSGCEVIHELVAPH